LKNVSFDRPVQVVSFGIVLDMSLNRSRTAIGQ
jgi:hypothetical protein